MKSTVNGRRSDLAVLLVRRSSSPRRSTDECPTPDDVSKTKWNSRQWKTILCTWVASKTSCSLSARDAPDRRTARYVFQIRKWKRQTRATDIWQNTWKWHITALKVYELAVYDTMVVSYRRNTNSLRKENGMHPFDRNVAKLRECHHTTDIAQCSTHAPKLSMPSYTTNGYAFLQY